MVILFIIISLGTYEILKHLTSVNFSNVYIFQNEKQMKTNNIFPIFSY